MAQLYKVSGEIVEVSPKNGTDFTFEELQAFVDGYIEIVPVFDTKYIVVNEDGRMKGLAHNELASAMVFGQVYGDIVGDMLLCDRSEIQ